MIGMVKFISCSGNNSRPYLNQTPYAMLQGFGATDLRDKTDEERKVNLEARIKDIKARRKKALKRGKPTDSYEADVKDIRAQIRALEDGR